MKKKRVMAGILVGALAVGGHQVWAATVHYNDSSVTGGSAEWQAWTRQWEQLANDYTQVSLTPGAAASQLNFAWQSEGENATPVVYFGMDADDLKAWEGQASGVDTNLTGGKVYSYNYVTMVK